MKRFAAAAAIATLFAVAGTASAWIGWKDATRQNAAAAGHQAQTTWRSLGQPTPSDGYLGADSQSGRTYYGWSYPFTLPFGTPRVIAQRPVMETHR
jgi:hypothetical protein